MPPALFVLFGVFSGSFIGITTKHTKRHETNALFRYSLGRTSNAGCSLTGRGTVLANSWGCGLRLSIRYYIYRLQGH